MTYRVFWSPYAEEQLERVLQDENALTALVTAIREINRSLAVDPIGFGESRFESVRVGFNRPLGVQYDVLEDVRTVIVDLVWRIDQKRNNQ
jgi:hypothetical protein